MASIKLHMAFDVIRNVLGRNASVRGDYQRQLTQINNAVENMGQSFKGKAGQAFLRYWQGSGRSHSQNIITHLEKLDDQIRQVQDLVRENDETCAALFSMN